LAKLAWLQSNAQSESTYIIDVNADEIIDGRSLSYDGKNNITITLKGIGSTRTISLLSENVCMFTVGTGITLILDNYITLRGRSNNTIPLVIVGGALIMNPGSTITGNKNTNTDIPGGGVLILKDGFFTMNGGTISNNTTNRNGGGVSVGGNFIFNDGNITGNNAKGGGGVGMTPDATFTMSGGIISGNRAEVGGGVVVGPAAFTMSGGTISGNRAEIGGGGVMITEGFFTKTGGIITGYASDTVKGNIVSENGIVKNGKGHAIVVLENRQLTKFKDTTSGLTDNMSYNASTGAAIGAWKKNF